MFHNIGPHAHIMQDQLKSLSAAACQSYECQWLLRHAVSYHVPLHYCPTVESCALEIESILRSHSKAQTALMLSSSVAIPVDTAHASDVDISSPFETDARLIGNLSASVLQLELGSIWASSKSPRNMSRTVWILWLQGWDDAPWLVQQVAMSWERHNPGWTIVRLDNTSISTHIRTLLPADIPAPAKSDLVRLALMTEQGGVWADATMLCMQSLDSWVLEALKPSGFWMFHGGGGDIRSCGGAASWFMVSEQGSPTATAWLQASLAYWEGRKDFDNYFW